MNFVQDAENGKSRVDKYITTITPSLGLNLHGSFTIKKNTLDSQKSFYSFEEHRSWQFVQSEIQGIRQYANLEISLADRERVLKTQ